MKKINILIILLGLSLFLFSCEKDEVTNPMPKNYVAGKWIIKEIGQIESVNNVNVIQYEDYVNDTNCGPDSYTFDETFGFKKTDFIIDTVDSSCDETAIQGVYSRSGSDLTLKYTEASLPVEKAYHITSLTYTTMDFNYIENGDNIYLKLVRE